MPDEDSEYFERIRSNKNFLGSLFLGILAGGVFSFFLNDLLNYLQITLHLSISLGIFVVISVIALLFSERSETSVSCFSSRISSSCFETLFKTFDHEVSCLPDGDSKQYLVILRNVLTKKETLTTIDATSLQTMRSRIDQEIQKQNPEEIRAFLIELKSMLGTIEGIYKSVIKVASEKTAMYENRHYKTKCTSDGIQVKKGKLRRLVISYKFESNLDYTIYNPLRCEVRVLPFVSYGEFSYLKKSAKEFLNDVANENSFLRIGLSFHVPTTREYLQAGFERISNELKQNIDRRNQVQDLQRVDDSE